MYDVFISYSRRDRDTVKKLADALISLRGWSVWWDVSVRTGDRFPRQIETALAESRAVLVVWSGHSVDSEWVHAEAAEGFGRGVLVPVRIAACTPPMPFRQTQTADLSKWHGSERAPELLALIEDVQRILAAGTAAGTDELLARQTRQRAFKRRRATLRWTAAAAAITLAVTGVLGYRAYAERTARIAVADSLAAESDALRERVLTRTKDEETTVWWWIFVDNNERLEQLEVGILLAVEAVRAAPTERANDALRNSLMLLPWSDSHLPIDSANHVGTLQFSRDAELIAAGGGSGDTLLWDYRAQAIRASIAHGGTAGESPWEDQHGRSVTYRGPQVLDFSPTDDVLATAGPDATARLWSTADGSELMRLEHADVVAAVTFSPDGRALATASDDGAVVLWDAKSGGELARMQHENGAAFVAFSPSGKWLATAGRDGDARVWSAATGEQVARLLHDEPAQAVRFSPDEKVLAVFGPDLETTLWTFAETDTESRLPVFSEDVIFADDGNVLVTGGTDRGLRWWRLSDREELFSVSGADDIRRIAASPTSRRLVSISTGEVASAWALDTGRELKQMPYAGWLTGVAVSPDGKLMASAGWDRWGEGALEVTEIWPENPVAYACAKLSRNLTRNEWRQYLPEQPYRMTCPDIEPRDDEEPGG